MGDATRLQNQAKLLYDWDISFVDDCVKPGQGMSVGSEEWVRDMPKLVEVALQCAVYDGKQHYALGAGKENVEVAVVYPSRKENYAIQLLEAILIHLQPLRSNQVSINLPSDLEEHVTDKHVERLYTRQEPLTVHIYSQYEELIPELLVPEFLS